MKNNNWYYLIRFSVIAIAILGIWNFSICNLTPIKKPEMKNPKEQFVSVEKKEDKSAKIIDSLLLEIKKIKKSGEVALSKLKAIQQKSKVDIAVYESTSGHTEKDYRGISEIISNSENSDSLCNEVVENLSIQIDKKDTLLSTKENMYQSLKKSFLESLDNQEKLNSYSNDLKKKLLFRKIGNTVWKSTAITLGVLLIIKTVK